MSYASSSASVSREGIVEKVLSALVGGLFIFSGTIKLNDPVGTAIKFEEYFEVFASDFSTLFHLFVPYALPLAVLFCVAEVVVGIQLLARYRTPAALWVLLLLIVFFTFLTFYSAWFNKVTDCGCFGDAIPLNPWQSFYKDVILLAMIGFLFFRRNQMLNYTSASRLAVVGGATALSFAIALYAIMYLPFIDFRAYKVGNNIAALMQSAVPCQYTYIMEKDGKEFRFDEYPTEEGYTYKAMQIRNEKECMPKITDYNLSSAEGEDATQLSLTGAKLWIIIHKTAKADTRSFSQINTLIEQTQSVAETMVLTSDALGIEEFRHKVQLAAPYYSADATVLKTMMRSDPGIMLVKDGVVLGKWHYNAVPSATEITNLLR